MSYVQDYRMNFEGINPFSSWSHISLHHTHNTHVCRVSFVDPVQGSNFTQSRMYCRRSVSSALCARICSSRLFVFLLRENRNTNLNDGVCLKNDDLFENSNKGGGVLSLLISLNHTVSFVDPVQDSSLVQLMYLRRSRGVVKRFSYPCEHCVVTCNRYPPFVWMFLECHEDTHPHTHILRLWERKRERWRGIGGGQEAKTQKTDRYYRQRQSGDLSDTHWRSLKLLPYQNKHKVDRWIYLCYSWIKGEILEDIKRSVRYSSCMIRSRIRWWKVTWNVVNFLLWKGKTRGEENTYVWVSL